ncbi:MAG: hypothetical protein ABIK44_07920 [candidate division WOR-3 bacterium]
MLVALTLVLVSGLDIGGHVGAAFPTGGLERAHGTSAILGASLGYSLGRFRGELAYDYTGLPGRQASSYHLSLHEVTASLGYEFLHRPGWGIEVAAGVASGFAQRSLGTGQESGWPNAFLIGLKFVQREGRSRLAAGLDNRLFIANRSGMGLAVIADLFSIQAGVGYVF